MNVGLEQSRKPSSVYYTPLTSKLFKMSSILERLTLAISPRGTDETTVSICTYANT